MTLDDDRYRQLFGMIEGISKQAAEDREHNAEFRGQVLARLASLRCGEHLEEVADLGRRTHKLELQAAAAKPFAVLGMALLGGILSGIAMKIFG